MPELGAMGVLALPVHDALVVREGDARVTLVGAFRAAVRMRPVVR